MTMKLFSPAFKCKIFGHNIVGIPGSLQHVWCSRCDKYLGKLIPNPKKVILM